ncbi:LysE family translocator [Galactobacter caseinivorans]|uniref:LysE family translocator n=1 Tax=Galactobacter caseinivorans TaxID=2676123 RepID=A0A496PJN1_9MICC|nr:LysE family translocator [Galactobacter caseinivorans]RKW70705.1 LysE family translocator [Galactobacter caseinivorans]
MESGMIWAFWGVSMLFIMTPGADWAYAISGGLKHRVLPSVTGLWAGHLLSVLVVAAGVGALLAQVPGALTALTLMGAVYLVWLGVGVLRQSSGAQDLTMEAPVGSPGRWFGKGIGVSGMNPKLILLMTAVMPQFTSHSASWPLGAQLLALGSVHLLGCAVIYVLVGLTAQRVLGTRPALARWITRFSGVAMILIGTVLAAERVAHWI